MKNDSSISEAEFLKNYDLSKYPRPSVTADVVVFGVTGEVERNYRQDEKKSLSLLLIKRGGHPCRGKWALPGGFLNIDETLEASAFRELKEETGLEPRVLMPMGSFSAVERDPRGRIISNAFIAIVDEENVKASAGDDASEARWFTIRCTENKKTGTARLELRNAAENLTVEAVVRNCGNQFGRTSYSVVESGGLAFDHAEIIATAYAMIQKFGNDFDVLFDFMPELFTLSGLQKVQETLLGITLQPSNFRRKVLPLVQETSHFTSGAGHRPAKLYRRRKP